MGGSQIAVTLKTAVLAIRSCLNDIKNDSRKATFLCENKDELKQISITFEDLARDYEDLYKDTIKEVKSRIKSDVVLVNVPMLKENETLVVKIGNEDRPAREEDIEEVQKLFYKLKEDKKMSFITHHAVEFVVVKTNSLEKAIAQ